MSDERDYVLGTHDDEIARLGLQHRVWSPRAEEGWRRAGFTAGQTVLDVGSGPGWAALDLATVVGPGGRVHAIDRSARFLDALRDATASRGIANVTAHELDLDHDALPVTGADGAWSRWVYAFVTKPRELLEKVAASLRPGGAIVLHEYVDYRAWRLSPRSDVFEAFVQDVMASWREHGGEPDIALVLPQWLHAAGFERIELRAISEAATPADFVWQWPRAFVEVGAQRLVDIGRMDAARAAELLRQFRALESVPGAFLMTPTVLEVVARRR